MLIPKLKLNFKSVKVIVMVATQFINALCTKQICLAAGCGSFCSAKIKFHTFVYNAAWTRFCLKLSVLHFVSYLFHNPHTFFFFCSLILPFQKHMCFCPPANLQCSCSYGDTASQVHLQAKHPILQYFLMSKRLSITQLGHSRPFSDTVSFIWLFSNHWGHKLRENSAFREEQSSVASPAREIKVSNHVLQETIGCEQFWNLSCWKFSDCITTWACFLHNL